MVSLQLVVGTISLPINNKIIRKILIYCSRIDDLASSEESSTAESDTETSQSQKLKNRVLNKFV